MRSKLSAIVAITVILGACTQAPLARPSRPASVERIQSDGPQSDVLLVQGEDGPVAISAESGDILFDRGGSFPSPDGSLLYSTTFSPEMTLLDTIDTTSGQVLSSTTLSGHLAIRAVSSSGRAIALTAPSLDPLVPVPSARTTIAIADPSGTTEPRNYVLDGNFEPEAFSVDDRSLFLIQHLPALAPAVYRVTALDLASGEVSPIRGRFDAPPEQMAGTRLSQIWGRGARQLYTLYSSERPSYARPTGGFDLEHPGVSFIHVLDARDGWAFCVTLPDAMRHHTSRGFAMAASADGQHLYLVDTLTGIVAVVDLASLEVTRYGSVLKVPPLPNKELRPAAVVSPDGRTLFIGGIPDWGLVAIDTATLSLSETLITDEVVSGVGSSVGGERLYAAVLDRVIALDAATGDPIGSVPFAGADAIVGVLSAA